MALEFVLGRVRRDIRLNGSFMAHCCPTTSFRPMAGKAEERADLLQGRAAGI